MPTRLYRGIMNDLNVSYLKKRLETNTVPHLMLFAGGENTHKKECAVDFAKKWMSCSVTKPITAFADLHMFVTEGKSGMHSRESIQELIHIAHLAPYEAVGRAFIIDNAERMLPTSANALLKIVEEPPPNTLIILLSSEPGKLMPTIRSRCQILRFTPLQQEDEAKKNNLYTPILRTLMQQEKPSFVDISAVCVDINKYFEDRRKRLEKELTAHTPSALKAMSAQAREKIDSELEGAVTAQWMHEVEALLMEIAELSKEHESVDLHSVDTALRFAKLSLERWVPLKHVLETLLLKLG